MKAPAFDAVLDFPLAACGPDFRAEVLFLGGSAGARILDYAVPGRKKAPFVRVLTDRPAEVRWADPFEVRTAGGEVLGRGKCLFPAPQTSQELKVAKRKALLARLELGEKDMIMALAEHGGLSGLNGEDLDRFARLSQSRLEELARALESEGRLRILGFAPLRLISQAALDFLRGRIVSFLGQYHKKHPGQKGAPLETLEKRFEAPRTVLVLALRLLAKEGRAVEEAGVVRLPDFSVPVSAADEAVLAELEGLVRRGEMGTVTGDDVRAKLGLSPARLQALLGILAERRKIVEGFDGFILHQSWLDEIIAKLRASGRRELTVADFKAMTGLTRKYSIPLLELLDSMGVTRRKGSVRDILK
ncbi:MAG TPA: SelB C-terminal domain-containing protein [Candidatus Aminicenantes bacterium]|nr:SelB C-terminal domain-containing protein [Candidatus Aminicenantes bacterium]HRY64128.1 SelB C-terminal domain-containing protein [Candidatus Aminicenantes bacterium]HRZ71041.1 SelB C-terminal domain-containing protein [Candidatus Aminicenantes bacterium]